MTIDPRHDRPHQGTGDRDWLELWGFDFADATNGVAGWVVFVHHPSSARAAYGSAVVGPDGRLVVVVDPAIRLAALTPSIEFRAEGIWAQHVCESAMSHWSVGLEAFGVALDDPADARAEQPWGDRLGVGYDLEWEATDEASGDIEPGDGSAGGFGQPCIVTGELLLDDLEFDLDAVGRRFRAWGVDAWDLASGLSSAASSDQLNMDVRIASPFRDVVLGRRLEPSGVWSLRLAG